MTYQDDPNTRPPLSERSTNEDVTSMAWLFGALAIVALIGGIVYATSTDDTRMASNEKPAMTTGSGTTTPTPTNPAGKPEQAPSR
jgi:hypothetical protein